MWKWHKPDRYSHIRIQIAWIRFADICIFQYRNGSEQTIITRLTNYIPYERAHSVLNDRTLCSAFLLCLYVQFLYTYSFWGKKKQFANRVYVSYTLAILKYTNVWEAYSFVYDSAYLIYLLNYIMWYGPNGYDNDYDDDDKVSEGSIRSKHW